MIRQTLKVKHAIYAVCAVLLNALVFSSFASSHHSVGPCSGGTFCTETETESGTEHGQETRHEEPVAFSECSSTYTGVTPLGEASEVSSDMSLSPPLIKGALLRKMQRTEPVVLLDRIKTTKSVTPWSQR